MKILAEGVNTYSLLNGDERKTGSILAGCIMGKAALTVDKEFQIKKIKTGLWHTVKRDSSETYATIKIASPGLIKIQIKNIKYHFRKSGGWKTRFMLLKQKEEVLALIPIIDWQKKQYEFGLQLNDEFAGESDAFLILHALHCACCCLMMMNGEMPVAISGI